MRLKHRLPQNFRLECSLARLQWAGHQYTFFTHDQLPDRLNSTGIFGCKAEGSRSSGVSINTSGKPHTVVIVKQDSTITASVNGKQVATKALEPRVSPPLRVLPEGTLTTGTDTFELVGDELRLRKDADITAAQSEFPITIRCAWSPVTDTAYSITPASRLAELIEYKVTDFTKGLAAYYPFNGNAKDESGNGNDGSVNGATLSESRHRDANHAYLFNGSDSITVRRIELGEEYSLCVWIRSSAKGSQTVVCAAVMNSESESYITLMHNLDGAHPVDYFRFNDRPEGRGGGGTNLYSSTSLHDNKWHQVVCTASRKSLSLNVDGTRIAENDRENLGKLEKLITLNIGMNIGNLHYTGQLDDIRIYNRALSPDEVKALYEYESPPPSQPVGQAALPTVAPFDAAQAKAHQKAWANHLGVPVETTNSIGMKFVVIPPGEFMMGTPEDEPGRTVNSEQQHKVTLSKPFQIGMHEVTQEQYEKVTGTNPSQFKGVQNPVEQVSWDDAVEYCRKLSALPAEQSAGYVYRLPTEAEWEYACRAGTYSRFSFGNDVKELVRHGWVKSNSDAETHLVGKLLPNPWGICDQLGNVWEWCSDSYGVYPRSPVSDPIGLTRGSQKICRGGSWESGWGYNSGNRHGIEKTVAINWTGFRVVRTHVD